MDEIGLKIIKALGLPGYVKLFQISFDPSRKPILTAQIFMTEEQGIELETVIKEYELVEKRN